MITQKKAFDVLEAFVLYPLCSLAQIVSQRLYNVIFGPKTEDLRAPDKARIYDVVMNFKQHFARMHGLHFFLLKFRELSDVSVIEEEDVVLYSLTFEEFQFVRVRPGVDFRDVEAHPFSFLTVHDHAAQVITLPRDTVFRYLHNKTQREGGRDGSNITLLHNIGRCGSTLLASMVYKTEQFNVVSEPFPLFKLAVMMLKRNDSHSLDCEENLIFLKAVLLLLCNKADQRYFVKITGTFSGHLIHLSHKVLPEIKDIFLYRSLVPTLSSFHNLLGGMRFFGLAYYGVNVLPKKYDAIWQKVKVMGAHEKVLFAMLCQMHPYYVECEKGRNVRAYTYESLQDNTEEFCKNFMLELGIPEEKFVSLALTALERDSQENSPLSKKNVARQVSQDNVIPQGARDWITKVGRDEFGIEIEGTDCWIANGPNSWSLGT